MILLKLFEGATFREGRIAINHARVIPVAYYHPLFNSSNYSGAPPNEQQGLWVLYDLFCQEVLFQPRGDHGSH
jgi:hypothetical protein